MEPDLKIEMGKEVGYLAKLMGIGKELYISVLQTLCEKYYVQGQADGIRKTVELRKGSV